MSAAKVAALDTRREELEVQRRRFLETLFEDGDWIDLRFIEADGPVERVPVQGVEPALEALRQHARKGVNCYAGVAPRRTGSGAKDAGGSENLAAVWAVWADIDFDPTKPADCREALKVALDELWLPWSMWVDTGGGVHVYWLFEEPVELTTPAGRERLENVLKGLADALGGDFKVTDATRILRIPGTDNFPDAKKRKLGRSRAPCELVEVREHRYAELDDFEPFEARGAALRAKRLKAVEYERAAWGGELPERVEKLLGKGGKLRDRWDGDTEGLHDPSDSGLDLAVADMLALQGVPGADIEAALRFRRVEASAKAKHGGYYVTTVEKALGWAKQALEAELKAKADAAEPTTTPTEPSPLEDGTDDGLAERLVRLHGRDLLYVPRWSRWYVWDGRRYRPDDGNAARGKMRDTVRSFFHDAAEADDPEQQKKLARLALKSRSMSRARAALWFAEAHHRVVVRPEELDTDPWALNVQNGTLDLRTGKLREHHRADRFTRLAPVAYDPTAEAPKWQAFLERVQPNEKMRVFLQRAVGYSLTSSTAEEAMFILHGGGANGKTTFLETVRAALGGDYAVELAVNALTVRKFGDELERLLAPIPGVRLATTIELREGQQLHEQAVKRLTSGEPLRARWLYAESFEFVPTCKVWMGTNHRPTVTGDDDGIWRRLRLVPFEVQIPPEERDGNLREKLREELPGVLRWAVEGCLAWQRDGLAVPESVQDATREYRSSEDVMGGFLAEYCTRGAKMWVSSATLRRGLERWCKELGEETPTMRALGDRLKREGFTGGNQGKRAGVRGWVGLDLTPEARASLDHEKG